LTKSGLYRLVAYFMNMFPAYDFDAVMKERAWVFFEMIDQAKRVEAAKRCDDIQVNMLPHLEKRGARQRIMRSYERLAAGSEITYDGTDPLAAQKLKAIFGQK